MLKKLTEKYISAFNKKDINEVANLLNENFVLEDPVVKRIEGKEECLKAIEN
ncbi:nuclear transport factor 2 family protein, partial [Campylobacter jejuni]|nr:nuclear transport factor 2 family protein [Campylobacter jejuni]